MWESLHGDVDEFSNLSFSSQDEETVVENLFKSWGLSSEILQILKESGMNSLIVLKKMELEDIESLFGRLGIKYFGERIKFKSGLREWRKKMNISLVCDASTVSANSRVLDWLEHISEKLDSVASREPTPILSSSSSETSVSINLPNLLKSSVRGQLVLSYYEKNGILDSKSQQVLTHCIVDSYVGSGRKMCYSDMRQWSHAISATFPRERPETYFIERKPGKKNPSGKLFSRWANSVKIENNTTQGGVEIINKELSIEDFQEKKCWLAHNCSPWEQVKSFWRDTSFNRIKTETSLTELLKEWPRFNDANGYELVEIDFQTLYPGNANQLFVKLDTFYKKIVPIFENEVKDTNSRENLLAKLSNQSISKDSKYCICALLLHSILQPQRSNKTHKPTIADAQLDFITLVHTASDVMPTISKLIKDYAARKETLQPRIIAVGTGYDNVCEFFIYCDGLKWRCCTFMKCIEIIIKLSYVFKIEYSHYSKKVWAFFEQYFLELKSEDFSSVSNLLSKLNS